MHGTYDVVVIGAGANGLVAAAALGRAGKNVLLVDGGAALGGQSRVDEPSPGLHLAPFAMDAGWVPPTVVRGLGLPSLESVVPRSSITVRGAGGEFLSLASDPRRAAEEIRAYSVRDSDRWPVFTDRVAKFSGILEALYQLPAPDIGTTSFSEALPMLRLGRKLRGLGRADMVELLRVLPMSVRDFLDDTFESELLKAAVGAGGVRDLRQGPRSGGTTYNLLHYLVGAPAGSVRTRPWWRAGPDAFTNAVASVARSAGVTIRTGAHVVRILVREDEVSGVLLDDAEEVFAPVVLSTADPVHTLLQLVDPVWFDPEFIRAVQNIRLRGCTTVVQYVVDRLPDVAGLDAVVSLTPSLVDLERAYDAAKYEQHSEAPHIELTAPGLRWPQFAQTNKHLLVARVQYTPYAVSAGSDASAESAVVQAVTQTVTRAFPSLQIHSTHALSPADIESQYGLTGGAVTHGEVALDQILFMRPVAGWARYAMPVRGLYLGGAGAHPGPGVLGGAGWLAAQAVLKRGT